MIAFLIIFIVSLCSIYQTVGKDIVELQSLNFELAITSYQYLAVLFYDSSEKGKSLITTWKESASSIDKLCSDCEMAMVACIICSILSLIE